MCALRDVGSGIRAVFAQTVAVRANSIGGKWARIGEMESGRKMSASVGPPLFAAGSATVLVLATAFAALRPASILDCPRCALVGLSFVSMVAISALVEFEPLALWLEIDPSTEALMPALLVAVDRR
jgi:hypothetical protein